MLRSGVPDQLLSDALPLLDMIIMDEYGRLPDFVRELFNFQSSSTWGEQSSTMAGLGAVPEASEGQSVAYEDPAQGYDKTYSHLEYKLAVAFSETLVEDNKFDMISKTYKGLGMSMYQTFQVVGAAVLNDGFADTGPDGSSLFNSSHTLIKGGTYGNRPSTDIALSVAGMREMEVDFLNQVDQRNLNIMLQPENIIVPPDLKHTAFELIKSQDRPDTANRATNTFYQENYKPYVWPYLSSATAWFATANKAQHELRMYERVKPYTKTDQDFDTGDVKTLIRCRFSVGYSSYEGTWGTTG